MAAIVCGNHLAIKKIIFSMVIEMIIVFSHHSVLMWLMLNLII